LAPFSLCGQPVSLAAILAALSLHPKIPFLADGLGGASLRLLPLWSRTSAAWTRAVVGHALLLRIKPKRLELPTPFRRSIPQPFNVDASRQAALNSSSDQLGREECERDGHIDVTNAASLA